MEGTVSTWEKEYGKAAEFEDTGKRFAYVLQQAHKRYGKRCVVLIEEYDKPILDVLDSGYSFSSETGTIEEWKATER